jgi:hypothetical protein
MGLPELPVVILVPRLLSSGFDLLGMGDIVREETISIYIYQEREREKGEIVQK